MVQYAKWQRRIIMKNMRERNKTYLCLRCGDDQAYPVIQTNYHCKFCGSEHGKCVFLADKYFSVETTYWEMMMMLEEARKKYVLSPDNPYYEEEAYQAREKDYLDEQIGYFRGDQKKRYQEGEDPWKIIEEKHSQNFFNADHVRREEIRYSNPTPPPAPKIKCPTCGSTKTEKIGSIERAASVLGLGLFSKKINKTFKCKDCGYTW